MKKIVLKLGIALALMALFGCSSTNQVSRVDDKQQVDLSGRWNDTDSRLVSEEMVKDALGRNWSTEFLEANSKKPAICLHHWPKYSWLIQCWSSVS